jgi:hypothetical protein
METHHTEHLHLALTHNITLSAGDSTQSNLKSLVAIRNLRHSEHPQNTAKFCTTITLNSMLRHNMASLLQQQAENQTKM